MPVSCGVKALTSHLVCEGSRERPRHPDANLPQSPEPPLHVRLCTLPFIRLPHTNPIFNLPKLDFSQRHITRIESCPLIHFAHSHTRPQPGRPTLFGTGRDRLPWTKRLPPAGKLASSRVALDLSGGMSLWDSFSLKTFILEGLAGILFIG